MIPMKSVYKDQNENLKYKILYRDRICDLGSSFQILNISLLESFVNLIQHLPTTWGIDLFNYITKCTQFIIKINGSLYFF